MLRYFVLWSLACSSLTACIERKPPAAPDKPTNVPTRIEQPKRAPSPRQSEWAAEDPNIPAKFLPPPKVVEEPESACDQVLEIREALAVQAGDVRPELDFDLATGLELFRDAKHQNAPLLQSALVDLALLARPVPGKTLNVTGMVSGLLVAAPDTRLQVARVALHSFGHEEAHAKARWGQPQRPITSERVIARVSAMAHVANAGRLSGIQDLLHDLERDGYEIVENPTAPAPDGDRWVELILALGHTRHAQAAELRCAAQLLATDDPALNITYLIHVAQCRRAAPASLARTVSGITGALRTKFPEQTISPRDAERLTRRVCAAYGTGRLMWRVDRAKRQIAAGADAGFVIEHFHKPALPLPVRSF